MMVKDVTKFYKRHLGGRGMLECVCVCVCVCACVCACVCVRACVCVYWISYRILSLGSGGGGLQILVLTWRGGMGACFPDFFLKNRCSEIDSEAFWGY